MGRRFSKKDRLKQAQIKNRQNAKELRAIIRPDFAEPILQSLNDLRKMGLTIKEITVLEHQTISETAKELHRPGSGAFAMTVVASTILQRFDLQTRHRIMIEIDFIQSTGKSFSELKNRIAELDREHRQLERELNPKKK